LVSFAIRNAAYLADQEIHFAPGFTCLIGGRGSGKSTIIEYLRFGLRQEADPAQSAVQQVARIGRTMVATTALRVKWLSGDGVMDAFAFSGAGGPANRAQVVDRDQPVASPDTVFNALQVQIFSQRQLSEMSGGTKLLEFVDRILRKSLIGPMETERASEAAVQALLNKARLLAAAQNELNQLEQSVIELERQWNSRSAVTTEAAAHKSAQEAKAFLENAAECVADAANSLNEIADQIPGKSPTLPADITGWPEPESVRAIAGDVGRAFPSLETELRALASRFQSTAGQLLAAQRVTDLRARIAAAETAFEVACTAQGITAEDVGRLREIDASLRAARSNRDAKRREVDRFTAETAGLSESLGAMHDAWREETTTRRQALERLETIINQSGRLVVSTIIHQGSTDDFMAKVWNLMIPDGRSRIGRSWDLMGKAIHKAFAAQTTPTSVWDFVEAWVAGTDIDALRPHADLREELREHLHNGKRPSGCHVVEGLAGV
jgi:DNA repair exonuclease SbcCD ATPase subunit